MNGPAARMELFYGLRARMQAERVLMGVVQGLLAVLAFVLTFIVVLLVLVG